MATKLEKVQAIIEELKELCETLIIGCVVIDDDNNKENGFAFVQGRSKFITEGLYEILKKSFVADREMRVANNLLLQLQKFCSENIDQANTNKTPQDTPQDTPLQ